MCLRPGGAGPHSRRAASGCLWIRTQAWREPAAPRIAHRRTPGTWRGGELEALLRPSANQHRPLLDL